MNASIISIIFLAILSLAHLLLVILLIPVLKQVRRTAKHAETTLDNLDKQLVPLLETAHATAEELQLLTISVNDKIDKTDNLFAEIGEASHVVATTSAILRDKVSPLLIQLAGVSSGVKAFSNFFKR
ncbi:MAG: DUF948 domain-containing protein [Desulfobulbaceae bacterium]|nr:DUF948 domain-containing protein [Desulfobulbaceae bacterium]